MTAVPQYTYVLDARGIPTRQWDAIQHILAGVTAHARRMKQGAIESWAEVEAWKKLVPGMFKVCLPDGSVLNADETARVVTQAISELATATTSDAPPDFRILLAKCDSAIARMVQQGTKGFAVYAKVGLPSDTASSVMLGNMSLMHAAERDAAKWVPTALRQPVNDEHRKNWQACSLPVFRINTQAYSNAQAMDEALRFLGVCRALVSLRRSSRGLSVQISGRRKRPLAPVPVGPVYALCDANDDEIEDSVWVEDYPHCDFGNPEILKQPWAVVGQELVEDLGMLARLSYRPTIESLLCKYITALDQQFWAVALLQLWNVLEQIAGDCKQEDIARRVACTYPRPELTRELVTVARCTRNRFVHAGHANAVNEQWAMVIQPLVEHHLSQLLENCLGVDTVAAYGERLMREERSEDVTP